MPRERIEVAAAEPAEPWRSFLRDLDAALKGSVELQCLGGFVVAQHYGIGRETADIDFLAATTQSPDDDVEALAGLGSALHRRYRLYVQRVTVATPPADREDVLRLAQAGRIDPRILKDRYAKELRPYLLSKLSWHDKTLEMWAEMAWPSK